MKDAYSTHSQSRGLKRNNGEWISLKEEVAAKTVTGSAPVTIYIHMCMEKLGLATLCSSDLGHRTAP